MITSISKSSHQKIKIKKRLAASITLLRRQHDWTQEDLANKCHWVEPSRISHYENLNRVPKLTDLVTIADLFEVTLDELIQRRQARERTIVRLPYLSGLPAIQKHLRSPTKHTDMLIPVECDSCHGLADYAVIVGDNKMRPFFDTGDLLLVSSTYQPGHGDYVLIKDKPEFTIRQLHQKGSKTYARTSAKHTKLVLITSKTPVLGTIVSRIKTHTKNFIK